MKKILGVLIALLILVRFSPLLLGKTIFFGDNYSLMVPGKIFTAYWLRQGILPFWNPTIFGGIPWIGDINQSILYPSTFLFSTFNPATALNWTVLLHIGMTAVGIYLLAFAWTKKRWAAIMATILWTYSTQVSGSINNLTTLQAIAWTPVVAWLATRKQTQPLFATSIGVVVALQVFAGYPQYVLYTVLVAVFLSAIQERVHIATSRERIRWILSWMRAGSIAVLLSASAWLPFIPVIAGSTRVIQTQQQSIMGSLRPTELIKIVIPYFFDHPVNGVKWGPAWNGMPSVTLYVTWIGLVLLGLLLIRRSYTRRDIVFGLFCLITLLFSFGDNLPGFALLQWIMPLFRASRGPSLILIATNLVLSLWVADLLTRTWNFSRQFTTRIVLVISGFLLSLLIVRGTFPQLWQLADKVLQGRLHSSAFHTLERDALIMEQITTNVFLNALLLGLAFMALKGKKHIFLAACILIEMHLNTSGTLFYAPHTVYPTWNEIDATRQEKVASIVGKERMLVRNANAPYTDFGTYWEALAIRKPFSDSYIDAQELRTYTQLKRMGEGYTPDWNMAYFLSAINGYTSLVPQDVNAVWNSSDAPPAINAVSQIQLDDQHLRDWGVKYYLVDTWFPNIPLIDAPIIYEEGSLKLYELSDTSRVRFSDGKLREVTIDETPNSVRINVTSDTSTSLILADRYDPNWNVMVNGTLQLLRTESGRREVAIEKGENRIEMTYHPRLFFIGVGISLVSMLVVLLSYFLRITMRLLRPNSKY